MKPCSPLRPHRWRRQVVVLSSWPLEHGYVREACTRCGKRRSLRPRRARARWWLP